MMGTSLKINLLGGVCLFLLSSCGTDSVLDYVDTSIGSGGHGHVFVGASVPFGMVQAGPTSVPRAWDWTSGYHVSDSTVVGFSHTHLSGTGIGDLCDVNLLPVAGGVEEYSRGGLADKADRSAEVSTPSYYSVPLRKSGVLCELTATARVVLHRYTFPESAESPAIVLDLANGAGSEHTTEASVSVLGSRSIDGCRHSSGWAKDQRLWFHAEFSEDVEVECVADNYWLLRLPEGVRTLEVKVALSSSSSEAAHRNMDTELPGWNFERVRKAAEKAWERELGKFRVDGGADKTVFYTSLYHTMIDPALFSDCGEPVRYTVFSLWDTYRAQMPLFTIMHPERVDDVMNTFLDIYDRQGTLPTWHLWGNETNCMVGKPGIMVTADAVLKGFRGFDTEKAVDAVRATAMMPDRAQPRRLKYGYLPWEVQPESVAWEMEYCIADRSVWQLTGDEYFLNRSNSWKIHFDPASGFMRGVDSLGRFREPFNPFASKHRGDDYCEGNAWQYIWLVPQDVKGLVDAFGGRERFVSKLDSLFIVSSRLEGDNVSADITGLIGQYAHGNEPSHHITYLYTMVGQPWKTADLVRRICTELYRNDPDGLCGNEDCGQMSAWYVLSTLGLYQVEPSGGRYWFGCPQFRSVSLRLPSGSTFRIRSTEGRYIQSVTLNGKEYDKPYIDYRDIMAGGELSFLMGDEPALWYEINI